MKTKPDRPLCIFDLETTGINIVKDRIVEIAILRVEPSGEEKFFIKRINPGIPIPPQASAIHGITDKDIQNAPSFEEVADEIYDFIKDAYLVGFNSNRFDLPLLVEELLRAGKQVDLKQNKTIDVQVIFHKMEPRNLKAAYKFYTGKNLENHHSAKADVTATWEVLKEQLKRYENLPDNWDELSEFSSNNRTADFQGRIIYDEQGREIINFGKYKGRPVEEVLEKDPGYFGWIQQADFPLYTKQVFRNVYDRIRLRKKFNSPKK
jgi:DNA polymerase-3 subunit epsilon